MRTMRVAPQGAARLSTKKEVHRMLRSYLRYIRYVLNALSTIGLAATSHPLRPEPTRIMI